ncbi:hypothetical protein [Enterococcus italicus]|uniref:hypothetical protein n=1 Tax=Enterococcus italicus TaxID=246144 RepID=UPI0028A94D22|nr:hypothetical protein [Enterococcus italicus]
MAKSENLTKHQLEIIADAVLKNHSRLEKDKKKEREDWKLRNTNLLLKNYRMLKKHCEGIIPTLSQFEETIFDPDELNLETLMKYKARTKEMIDYFDIMFSSYNQYCHNQGTSAERRFDVINKIYVTNPSFSKSQMAGIYDVDDRTIQRDIKRAGQELSVFLFGIDSLDDLSNVLFVS